MHSQFLRAKKFIGNIEFLSLDRTPQQWIDFPDSQRSSTGELSQSELKIEDRCSDEDQHQRVRNEKGS
jgi:hypothetical protein